MLRKILSSSFLIGALVRMHRVINGLAHFTAFTLFLSALEARAPDSGTSSYSHGEITCLEGDRGPGLRLRLRQHSGCEGRTSYPYLEIDIRELPIAAQQRIAIGGNNWAFKCRRAVNRDQENGFPIESCEPSGGGKIVFEHYETTVEKGSRIDGSYELRFRTGAESGHFRVECQPPCG